MEKISWQDKYSVGNNEIDKDHKELLSIYNQLITISMEGDFQSKDFVQLLSKMTDYSLSHFVKEEQWMRSVNFSNFEAHEQDHKTFIYKVAIFNLNFKSNNTSLIHDLIQFLKNWFENHIQVFDKEIENFKI